MNTYRLILPKYSDELYHHGILGMKWGRRNGPPYPLDENDHSSSERKAGWKKSLSAKSSSGRKLSGNTRTNEKKDIASSKKSKSSTRKKAIIIGASIAVAGLAAYGVYKSGVLNKINVQSGSEAVSRMSDELSNNGLRDLLKQQYSNTENSSSIGREAQRAANEAREAINNLTKSGLGSGTNVSGESSSSSFNSGIRRIAESANTAVNDLGKSDLKAGSIFSRKIVNDSSNNSLRDLLKQQYSNTENASSSGRDAQRAADSAREELERLMAQLKR